MIDIVTIGKKIQSYRKKHNMTQDELADKLFVTRQALSKWETGGSYPSLDVLDQLTKIFNVSFEEILGLNDNDDIDVNNIFVNHSREYIINKIIKNEIENIYLPDVFYQFSPSERMQILKAIKENKITTNQEELLLKLTESEKRYLL